MINDSLLSTFYKFHDHKQKNMKAFKKFLFPLKFKIFEIRGFDSTATICLTQKLVGTTVLLNRANRPDVLLEDLISSIYMRDNFKANDALVTVVKTCCSIITMQIE